MKKNLCKLLRSKQFSLLLLLSATISFAKIVEGAWSTEDWLAQGVDEHEIDDKQELLEDQKQFNEVEENQDTKPTPRKLKIFKRFPKPSRQIFRTFQLMHEVVVDDEETFEDAQAPQELDPMFAEKKTKHRQAARRKVRPSLSSPLMQSQARRNVDLRSHYDKREDKTDDDIAEAPEHLANSSSLENTLTNDIRLMLYKHRINAEHELAVIAKHLENLSINSIKGILTEAIAVYKANDHRPQSFLACIQAVLYKNHFIANPQIRASIIGVFLPVTFLEHIDIIKTLCEDCTGSEIEAIINEAKIDGLFSLKAMLYQVAKKNLAGICANSEKRFLLGAILRNRLTADSTDLNADLENRIFDAFKEEFTQQSLLEIKKCIETALTPTILRKIHQRSNRPQEIAELIIDAIKSYLNTAKKDHRNYLAPKALGSDDWTGCFPRKIREYARKVCLRIAQPATLPNDNKVPALLLYGPKGVGKSTLAASIGAREIKPACDRRMIPVDYFVLTTGSLHDQYQHSGTTRINALRNRLTSNKNRFSIIFIDEIDRVVSGNNEKDSAAVELATLITDKNLAMLCCIICATNHLEKVPEGLRDKMKKFKMSCPTAETRRSIIKDSLEAENIQIDETLFNNMVNATTGYSYRDLIEVKEQFQLLAARNINRIRSEKQITQILLDTLPSALKLPKNYAVRMVEQMLAEHNINADDELEAIANFFNKTPLYIIEEVLEKTLELYQENDQESQSFLAHIHAVFYEEQQLKSPLKRKNVILVFLPARYRTHTNTLVPLTKNLTAQEIRAIMQEAITLGLIGIKSALYTSLSEANKHWQPVRYASSEKKFLFEAILWMKLLDNLPENHEDIANNIFDAVKPCFTYRSLFEIEEFVREALHPALTAEIENLIDSQASQESIQQRIIEVFKSLEEDQMITIHRREVALARQYQEEARRQQSWSERPVGQALVRSASIAAGRMARAVATPVASTVAGLAATVITGPGGGSMASTAAGTIAGTVAETVGAAAVAQRFYLPPPARDQRRLT